MKKTLLVSSIAISLILFVFTSCKDKVERTYTANSPVYMTYADLRTSVSSTGAQAMVNPGKIYFKDSYIFICEQELGIHVIDNSDPSSPAFVAFINIPGNVDIAIKNNSLYADSYIDLVVLDISNISNITEINREINVFPYTTPAYDFNYPVAQIDEGLGVIIDWEIIEVTEEVDMQSGGFRYYDDAVFSVNGGAEMDMSSNSVTNNSVGQAGSMARFTICQDHLYTIDYQDMRFFDLADATSPTFAGELSVGWDIETVFPNGENLFIGSQSGMYIYDVSNPTSPTQLSMFSHVNSCDPVVMADGYAYVTLRGGTECGGFDNQLDVLDVSNLSSPQLLASYSLTGPYGLGIDANTLFVCDGTAGLKVYDVADKLNIDDNIISTFPDNDAYDVIPVNDVLIMIGSDGLFQYDYTDLNNLVLLSSITVN